MRVHACRHCGEVFPSYPDLRQHLDSHVQPPIGHICTTCGRAFTRRDHLQRHASRCRPKPFVCATCNSSFGRKQELDCHVKTVKCGGPPQPGPSAPKRRRIASLDEDPLTPPSAGEAYDELSSDLQDAVRDNWGSIRAHAIADSILGRTTTVVPVQPLPHRFLIGAVHRRRSHADAAMIAVVVRTHEIL